MTFTANMLIQYRNEQNSIYRIIWISESYDTCFVINIFDNSLPMLKEIAELENGLVIGAVAVREEDPFNLIIREEEITDKARTARADAWNLVSKLMAYDTVQLLDSPARNKIIREISEELNVNPKKIIRYLKRYWKRGMHINSLLPDFHQCGGIGVEKSSSGRKRGRPKKYLEEPGINVDEEIKRKFELGINKFYLRQNNVTARFAYEQILKEYFREELDRAPNELPTYNQFLYWLRKNENISKRIIKRYGKRKFELQYRPVLGSVQQEVRSPGQKVMLDSTVSDLYLCSEYDRQAIIGRAGVYFVKDVFSRMVLAVHVFLEGSSFEQARICLMNMVENKVDFCKRFGVDIEEHDWPTAHLPESILADRAELLSHASTVLTERLGISIETTAPYRGDFKNLVEQQFAVLNRQVKPLLPGAIQKDFGVRGANDYRLASALTLKDLTKVVILSALQYNNNFIIDNYVRDEEMIEADVLPIPSHLFRWGMKHRAGKLRTISKEQLMLELLPTASSSITEFGIKWKGMLYTNETALREQWFVEARYSGRKKITITYDPRDVSIIYVKTKDNRFERCHLLEHQVRYKDKHLEEVTFLQEKEMKNKQYHKSTGLKEKINLTEQVEEIVKEAVVKSKKDKTSMSKQQRLKDIRSNRQKEIEAVRKETFRTDHNLDNEEDKKKSGKENEKKLVDFPDDLALLKKYQKKGLGSKDE